MQLCHLVELTLICVSLRPDLRSDFFNCLQPILVLYALGGQRLDPLLKILLTLQYSRYVVLHQV